MKKFLTAAIISAAVIVSGCSAFGATKLEQLHSAAQVAFLAQNYSDMRAELVALPMNESERDGVNRGLVIFDDVRDQLSRIAKGDIDADLVLNLDTAAEMHAKIGKAYNTVVMEGLKPFSRRTGWFPGMQFIQYDRIGKSVWQAIGKAIATKQAVKLQSFVGMLKIATTTFVAVKGGKVGGRLLGPSI
jgi:outer membrane murein-binding lipoprotein Lpp